MSVSRNSGPGFIVRRRSRQIPAAHPTNPSASTDTLSLHTSKVSGQSSMTFPRSSHYERLEGGLGPSRLGVRNIAWRRIVLCLTVIVGFAWILRHTLWSVQTPGEPLQTFAGASVVAHNDIEGTFYSVESTRGRGV